MVVAERGLERWKIDRLKRRAHWRDLKSCWSRWAGLLDRRPVKQEEQMAVVVEGEEQQEER